MDDAFEKLKNEGKNSVDNLVRWLKDSNIIENTKDGEDKAKKLFEGVKDISNVEIEKFKAAVTKLADEQQKTVEDLANKLNDEGPKLLNALKEAASSAVNAGLSSFKDAMKK